ncbi:hypothetical protein RJ639_027209 [Escallonia herrerae]|uniref:Chromatin-remodeling ATPase INO80 n=1 Tax=Escallonia herrerae TaxID=1293975 RepID=A0AA88X480_9ASTE|nr:hypothetical protein RJ639_027209 [Escallonia herrerae]
MGHSRGSYTYSNLFNLESLMNFQLPQLQPQDDDFDYYGNSSQDESRGSQGGAVTKRNNPIMSERGKKRRNTYSSDEDEEGSYNAYISEEQYRAMLGEHIKKYKRRVKNSSPTPVLTRTVTPVTKGSLGHKERKLGNEHRAGLHKMESSSEFFSDGVPQKLGKYKEADLAMQVGSDRSVYEPAYLDIGDGITYRIPLTYEKLTSSLNLPSMSEIRVEEFYLKGTLDLGSLAAMMAADKRFEHRTRVGMGEPKPQFESLQARLKAQAASNSVQNFSLKVDDIDISSSCIPEGAAGGIRRSILSEGGLLQIYYVKVLEKGDTYEIIERSLPKKQKVKKDPSMIEKEEMEKIGKCWVNIVRKDIPKHHRIFTSFHRKQLADAKRFSETCQREVKMKVSRSLKLMKGAAIRTRKLARDMLVFWKRVDKEMAEVRKREEKEAAEALKREQELREAKRQQQRLNFLLSQTELYSHFMQNKSASQPSEDLATGSDDQEVLLSSSEARPAEEEDPVDAELKMEALKAAQDAVSKQKKITSAFDNECLKLRQVADTETSQQDALIEGSSNIDLLHPSTMPVASSVQTPELFKGSLKDYQLKGLQWLVNCYEQVIRSSSKSVFLKACIALCLAVDSGRSVLVIQGLNGILADEMGLGKTIQAMTFLAHLAEEKNIWGPFLVVAPSSVLNNWADEISRFCPDLKVLPYWGGVQERTILRKNMNPKRLYRREAGFHICITSYQLLVSDEKYLRRLKWQYMHAILKPFMLRRVKKDVVTELTVKTEIAVHCKLSSRQKAFYQAIKNNISLAELFNRNRGHQADKHLLNIVMQLRKVCNHPELFERNEGSSYLYFGEVPNSLLPAPFGELEDIYYSGSRNPITYMVPKLIYHEVVQNSDMLLSAARHIFSREFFEKRYSIFSPENVYRSILAQDNSSDGYFGKSGTFGFTHLIDLSPAEVAFLATGSSMERLLFSIMRWDRQFLDIILDMLMEAEDDEFHSRHLGREKVRAVTRMLLLPSRSDGNLLRRRLGTGPGDAPYEALVLSHQDRLSSNFRLLHSAYSFIPRARAPPINAVCSDRNFAYKMIEEHQHPWVKRLLVGFARTSERNGPRKPIGPHHLIQEIDSELPVSQPALQLTYEIFGSCPPMRNFDFAKMLTDSGKLQTLDILLKRLRTENHRVLLFAQMTKMLDILEDYMNYRKYRYLRLDGSSTIMDRRDMVRDFQHRNDIFVFLLSTRAGGLGINLTAADTVIFYESDWNPTLDLQAMDRAHRLGQTKDVTVYRLVLKDTIEEKILQRASQKNTVQQLVMTGGHVQGDDLEPEDVLSLLIDDAQMAQKLKELPARDRQRTKKLSFNEEGDLCIEDVPQGNGHEPSPEPEKTKSTTKKRKPSTDKQTPAKPRPQKALKAAESSSPNSMRMDYELDVPLQNPDGPQDRPKRQKRPTKSVNDNLEPAFTASPSFVQERIRYLPATERSSSGSRAGSEEGTPRNNNFPTG